MKKKTFLSLLLAVSLWGCKSNQIESPTFSPNQVIPQNISEEEPLMATVESREEAEAIAQQYGITLVSWGYGIATFFTEENPQDVIQRGLAQGWPELSLNLSTPLS